MKVLLLAMDVVDVPRTGGGLFVSQLAHFLAAHHETTVISFASQPHSVDPANFSVLSSQTQFHAVAGDSLIERSGVGKVARILRLTLSKSPTQVLEFDYSEVGALVAEWQGQGGEAALGTSVPAMAAFQRAGFSDAVRKIYWAMDIEFRQAAFRFQGIKHRLWGNRDIIGTHELELAVTRAVDEVIALTEKDAIVLREMGDRDVTIIPPLIVPAVGEPQAREPGLTLLTTNLHHPPNVDAIHWLFEEVYPKFKRRPRLVVTGGGDFSKWKDLPDVEFAGFIDRSELESLYRRCAVSINPTRTGTGFQMKLLEALSFGCPVVSTEFSNPLGDVVPASDDPAEFAELVEKAAWSPTPGGFDYPSFYESTTDRLQRLLGGSS